MRALPSLPDSFPLLTAGEIALREILPSDAADWHRYLSDPRVNEFTSAPEMAIPDVEDLIAMFAANFLGKTQIRWALTVPQSSTMIGDCGYNAFFVRDGRAEIGYNLAPEYWRRGIMTNALSAVIDYGFSSLGLNKIEATVGVNNTRSSRLLRKLGFQLEGTLRDYRNRRGVFGDSLFFGLLRREWPAGGVDASPAK
jgi:ribosomal-protein-alanine N-acetyltransferase